MKKVAAVLDSPSIGWLEGVVNNSTRGASKVFALACKHWVDVSSSAKAHTS